MAYRLMCIKSCIFLNVVNPHFPDGTPSCKVPKKSKENKKNSKPTFVVYFGVT